MGTAVYWREQGYCAIGSVKGNIGHANCAAGVEDIHGLMGFSKKAPKPHLQAAYFKALTRIFFVSGAYLFHAYAWQKLYILTKNQKKKLPVS